MCLLIKIAFLPAFVLAVTIAQAQSRKDALPAFAVEAWNAVKGPAAARVFRYAKNKTITCYITGVETECSLASRSWQVSLFYIYTDNRSSPEYAFAVIYYSQDTGNGLWFDVAIFQRTGSQGYAFKRNVNDLFGKIDSVGFDGKEFVVTTATLTENDSRCCPSGRTDWRVDIATGKARYVSGNRVGAGLTATVANAESSAGDKLFSAIETGNVDQIAKLLRGGVSVDVVNARGYPPLAYLVSFGQRYRGRPVDRLKIAELLISHGADVNGRVPKSLNPSMVPVFVWAINTRDENVVGLFLKNGANPTMDNSSPLFAAAEWGNINIVRVLMSKGAKANAYNEFGQTPLFRAQNAGVAKLLIDAGADVNDVDQWGQTPLFSAENVAVAKLLIDAGADVNAKNGDGVSVISWHSDPPGRCGTRICEPINKELIKYLRSRGAKTSQ
jgi:ankyrin repeat protein